MSRPTMRTATGLAAATIMLATLSGCGISPYCKAIQKNEVALNSLGQERTTAAYQQYAAAFTAVARVAPKGIRPDWTKLASVTQGVLAAQRAAGISLEDMLVESKVKQVPPDRLKVLNSAYEAFNNTTKERKAVVKSAKEVCEIRLS